MSNLLARFANNIFWLARYMERAENLARLLDVNETFARDQAGTEDWLPILEINSDTERYLAAYGTPAARNVVRFYVMDMDNPTSILFAVRQARESARSLRHVITTEMWGHLNTFYNKLNALKPRDLKIDNLSTLCSWIKVECQTHTGITEGTLYRDQVWCFYLIGKYLERADQTSRLLDIKYRQLQTSEAESGSPIDESQWNAVLRSAAGYQAFRRTHGTNLAPESVAGFLLADPEFPRSMASSITQVHSLLRRLEVRYGLRCGKDMMQPLENLSDTLQPENVEHILKGDPHVFIDRFQRGLIGLTNHMRHRFFGDIA